MESLLDNDYNAKNFYQLYKEKKKINLPKGKLGIELNLNKGPCRETKMTPYEIMLSESQERMLIVLENGKEQLAKKIFDKWNLDFAIIGKTTNSKKI